MSNISITSKEYLNWIGELKAKIRKVRTRIALSVNSAVIELYWEIGKDIYLKQKNAKWGSKIIDQIAIDLKHDFPDIKGLSRRNIYAMRQFYLFYSNEFEFVPQAVAQIPWGHNRLIISKLDMD
jgi:predicted nuclease of restriction endonuclease-like (RecB) superfamily